MAFERYERGWLLAGDKRPMIYVSTRPIGIVNFAATRQYGLEAGTRLALYYDTERHMVGLLVSENKAGTVKMTAYGKASCNLGIMLMGL